ncbi:peroxidase 57 [Selaginella moellendorffii]|nr:peroxidase 57 [Selaginella moellendorffii]|eukprot:XP_002991114.2 peroxidase 57 [Selaginella moellendorffii]
MLVEYNIAMPCVHYLSSGITGRLIPMPWFSAAMIVVILTASLELGVVQSSTVVGYYSHSCPAAEKIVSQVVAEQFATRPLVAAGILRLYFHDCFVEGCDGSILLDASPDGTPPEKRSLANNNTATGFELVDAAKRRIEAVCPGTVSCADILALAARDSVAISGGPRWEEPTGRYDGRVSLASNADGSIPGPSFNLTRLIHSFANKTLDSRDLVTLSGGHTIGRSHCANFQIRLYNSSGTGLPDPALNPAYATALRRICPNTSPARRATLSLDRGSEIPFDNSYFVQLLAGNGLLRSDEELLLDGSMRGLISAFAANQRLFFREFAKAMVKLGGIGVKDSIQGEIRLHCRRVNRRNSGSSPRVPTPPPPIMRSRAPPPPY